MVESRSAGTGLPASAVKQWIGLSGLAALVVLLAMLPRLDPSPDHAAALAVAAAMLPVVALELLVGRAYRHASAGLLWDRSAPIDIGRSAVKLLGLAATLAGLALCYWAFPLYHGDFYQPLWDLLYRYGVYGLIAAIPYFLLIDARMQQPEDGYWQVGMLLLCRFARIDRAELARHVRTWVIKGFYTPLMFGALVEGILVFYHFDFFRTDGSFQAVYFFASNLLFTVDLVFALAGYLLTVRLLDAHVRSAEPTVLGWLAAIICYEPFWTVIASRFLRFEDDMPWGPGLGGWPLLPVLWGVGILALLAVYAWATVSFGCRFSNLTHRGILTSGPYRVTKHPAYIAKNLSWWMIWLPFMLEQEWVEGLRDCIMLLLVNGIYLLRARTEEAHLSLDPDYVAYAAWMRRHGWFRWLARWRIGRG